MAFWKQKYNRTDGFSLVEIVVAITILGFVAVPMFTGLLFSYQLNQRSDEKMQAQLAVSSAVETIMAEGFDTAADYAARFPNVSIEAEANEYGYDLKVTATDEKGNEIADISVETFVRSAPTTGGDGNE